MEGSRMCVCEFREVDRKRDRDREKEIQIDRQREIDREKERQRERERKKKQSKGGEIIDKKLKRIGRTRERNKAVRTKC